jgi:tetratricopeptide (TPR) repeat protein
MSLVDKVEEVALNGVVSQSMRGGFMGMRSNAGVAVALAVLLLSTFLPVAGAFSAGREGEVVPFFKAEDVSGDTVDLRGLARMNRVVVFFWHSYKTMSIREMNYLNDMYRFYNLYGLEIIGIEGGGREREGVAEELEKLAIIGTAPVYTIIPDPGGRLSRQYRVEVVPETFIIGRDGRILYHLTGFRDEDRAEMERKLKELLGLLPGPPASKREDSVTVRQSVPIRKQGVSVDPERQKFEKCSYFGNYYFNLGDLEKSLAYYEECVAIDPADISIQLKIGEVYAKLRNYGRARETWENVLRLDPGNSEASTLIRRLVRGEF